MEQFLDFVQVVLGFVPVVAGGAVAIAALVDGLKKIGVLPDGYAQLASLALNAALFAVMFFLGEEHGSDIQGVLDGIVTVAPVLVSVLIALLGTKWAHELLKGVGLGYSHDEDAVG